MGIRQNRFQGRGNKKEILFVTIIAAFSIILLSSITLVLLSSILYPGWSDFLNAFHLKEIGFAIKLSFKTSCITTLFAMIIGIPTAYFLSRYNFPFKTIVDTILDLPIVLPPGLIGLSLLVFFQTPAGKTIENLFGEFAYQQRGIPLAQFFVAAPLGVRAVKAAFDSVNDRFEVVARTLGASKFTAFYSVTLPMAKNGIIAGAIITWARAIAEFGPILFFSGATRMKTEVMPISIYLFFSVGQIETALVLATLMIAMSAITLIVFKKLGGTGYMW